MKFKYVDVKTVKNGTHRVMFTEDMKYFKGVDMITALGTKFIYSITSTLEENGINVKVELKPPQGNRVYQFIEVGGILKLEELIDKLYPLDENKKRNFPREKRGYFESQLIALRDYKQAMVMSGILKLEEREAENPKVKEDTAQHRINIIFDELLKLSSDIDTKVNVEELGRLSKELSDTKAELQRVIAESKSLAKEEIAIKKQLQLSEAKYEEVKSVNLTLVSQRDILQAENIELKKFKSNIEQMLKR